MSSTAPFKLASNATSWASRLRARRFRLFPPHISRKFGAVVNYFLEPLGLQIRRLREPLYLSDFGIATILDVGANTGQFAARMRKLLPGVTIHSFEPLPDVFTTLEKEARRHHGSFAHHLALGEESGEVEMQRNAYSPSSSLLPMADAHIKAFPATAQTQPIRVPMMRLEDWAKNQNLKQPLLVKLDVQGFEDRVLRGGESVIRTARILVLEMSFYELYHGQPLFEEIYSQVLDLGFKAAGFDELVIDPYSGKTLQADMVFVSRNSPTATTIERAFVETDAGR